jgi:hypothetical protein
MQSETLHAISTVYLVAVDAFRRPSASENAMSIIVQGDFLNAGWSRIHPQAERKRHLRHPSSMARWLARRPRMMSWGAKPRAKGVHLPDAKDGIEVCGFSLQKSMFLSHSRLDIKVVDSGIGIIASVFYPKVN